MKAARLAYLGAALAAAACAEDVAAPGKCPDYCPSGQITVVDTVLDAIISRDSAFRGYVTPHQAGVMLAADTPFVASRAIFAFSAIGQRLVLSATDTGVIKGADSARLELFITRRDSAASNLTLRLYRLPIDIDTTTTFAQLTDPFRDSLVRTVNIDTLLAFPGRRDPVTGDSIVVDTTNRRLVVLLKLDSSQARYVFADSGKVAYGVRVSADSLASIALGKGDIGPLLQWYLVVDSLGVDLKRTPGLRSTPVATFVFAPPPAPIDSTLAVGGVPSARSFLRVAFPRAIRDSAQILRGTLVLIPAVAARGAPVDSFVVEAHAVLADFGAKSPLALDVTRTDTTIIHVDSLNPVEIEVTNLLQFWQRDTTQATTLAVRAKYEGADFAEIRFYPSSAVAYRPALHVTYVPRFPFGKP